MNKNLRLIFFAFYIIFSLLAIGIASANENFEQISVKVEGGDNLFRIFARMNIEESDAKKFIKSLKRRIDLRRIAIGQTIDFYFNLETKKLSVVSFPLKRNITVLAWKEKNRINSARISDAIALERIKAVFNMENFRPKPGQYEVQVKKGDNLTKILSNYGADLEEIQSIIVAISVVKNLKKLKPKDKIIMFYESSEDGVYINQMELIMSGEKILVKKDGFGIFRIDLQISVQDEKKISINEYDVSRGDTILGQLKDAGWTKKEAREAVNAFATVYDPNKIKIGSKIIFPKDIRIRAFAFVIDKNLSILITSIGKGKFLAKKEPLKAARALLASLKYAEVIEIKEKDEIDDKQDREENLNLDTRQRQITEIPITEDIQEVDDFYVPAELVEGEILRGDSLMSRLYKLGENKKSIKNSIAALSKITNPNLIKAGSDFIVALGQSGESMRGFYIGFSRKNGFLVKIKDEEDYEASKISKKNAIKILLKIKKANLITQEVEEEKWISESFIDGKDYEILSFEFKSGDTLSYLLSKAKVNDRDSFLLVNTLKKVYNPKNFYIGQKVKIVLSKDASQSLLGVIIELDKTRSIEVFYSVDSYKINRHEKKTFSKFHKKYGEVDSSLYLAAKNVGMPIAVLMDLVKVFSFDVDFQREIRSGDAFEVIYERRYVRDDNNAVDNGKILRAALILGGEKIIFYRFDDNYNGISDYFDAEGRSVRKALMRTPLDGARLTSKFGKRKHPILGYTKMHRGVDFGAPRNTPVYAAGDGVIEFMGRNGGYGKYILIRHNSDYKTAYAHLSKFAKFLQTRKRVKQGEVIGYVGSTGRSTGPHLHYEILFRGKQVNPFTVRLPQGIKLSGKLYQKFSERRDYLDRLWNDL